MKTIFKVRKAEEGDAKAILETTSLAIKEKTKDCYSDEVLNSWAPDAADEDSVMSIVSKVKDPDRCFFVAENENKDIIGSACITVSENYLSSMYVKKNDIGGVGQKLFDAVVECSKSKGMDYLTLRVPTNAKDFFLKNGCSINKEGVFKLRESGIEMECANMEKNL